MLPGNSDEPTPSKRPNADVNVRRAATNSAAAAADANAAAAVFV
jgi:hypothetical protein